MVAHLVRGKRGGKGGVLAAQVGVGALEVELIRTTLPPPAGVDVVAIVPAIPAGA
jgi:hypothetical protein